MTNRKLNRRTFRTLISGSVAVAALVGMTIAGTAQAADGGGIRNCVDISGQQANRVGCYEKVWSGDVEYRMTFSTVTFSGSTPQQLDPFYVLAPQRAEAQGYSPTFLHDHVSRAIPTGNGGTYSTRLQGYFVLCSGPGLISGSCVPLWTSPGGDPLPFAKSVDGHDLTSADTIEAAAAAGDLVLVNLGPNAVIVGSISDVR
jgi:hypothetical protein